MQDLKVSGKDIADNMSYEEVAPIVEEVKKERIKTASELSGRTKGKGIFVEPS